MGADGQSVAAPRRRGPLAAGTIARAAAALTAVLALYTYFTLPPRALRLRGEWPATHVPGAIHVHTARAGGSGTPDDIARAASDAGLRFVLITDHGDATRPPDPPQYRHGVLCLDTVEIGTEDGHVLAIGLGQASPFPLAGAGTDVIEDIRRLGGFAVAAHPDSPEPTLSWRGDATLDGLEWLNADSEWRDESRWRLAASLPRLLVRGPETIVSLFDRPGATMSRWDRMLQRGPVMGLAAGDAHARIGAETAAGESEGFSLRLPSYEAVFRALAQVAVLPQAPTGDAAQDAAMILDTLRRGRSYSVISGIAAPAPLEFVAEQGGRTIQMGDSLAAGQHAILTVRVPTLPPAGIALLADGQLEATGRGTLIAQRPAAQHAFRVEVYFPGRRVPWIVSNPIFVRRDVAAAPTASQDNIVAAPMSADAFDVEHDPSSTARLTPAADGTLRLDAALGGGPPAGQFAAAVAAVPSDIVPTGVRLTARAERPMRLSIQLRATVDDVRWRRSVYVDSTPRTFTLPLDTFRPIRHDRPHPSSPGALRSLLIVVDTLNTQTGTTHAVVLSDVGLLR